MKDKEIWQEIKDFSRFEVSTFGRIRHKKLKKVRKLYCNPNIMGGDGYLSIKLYNDTKDRPINVRVHRIVANTFIPKPDGKTYVDHMDRNRYNNNVSNLRWVTARENRYNQNPKPQSPQKLNKIIEIISLYLSGLSIDEIYKEI